MRDSLRTLPGRRGGRILLAFAAVAATMTAASGEPNPWSRWRGANGAGQGGGARFPVEWTDAGLPRQAALPGARNASPVA